MSLLRTRAEEQKEEAKPQYILKLSSVAPEGSIYSKIGHQFEDYVYEKSGGRLKAIWYFGAVMGDEPDAVRKIRMGQLQGAGFTLAGLGRLIPETHILELPFLFNNYDEVDYILEKMNPHFTAISEKRGMYLAGWFEVGFVHIFSHKPIKEARDLKGMKMWLWGGDPILEESLKVLGFENRIPVGLPEVLVSLQIGMIDSFICTPYMAVSLQWYTRARYLTSWPILYTPSGMIVDKNFFYSLPPDLQELLLLSAQIFLPKLTQAIRKDNETALRGLYLRGLNVTRTDKELIEELRQKSLPVYKKFANDLYPEWLLNEILDALSEFRAKNRGKNP